MEWGIPYVRHLWLWGQKTRSRGPCLLFRAPAPHSQPCPIRCALQAQCPTTYYRIILLLKLQLGPNSDCSCSNLTRVLGAGVDAILVAFAETLLPRGASQLGPGTNRRSVRVNILTLQVLVMWAGLGASLCVLWDFPSSSQCSQQNQQY